jgi:hypothetical protein
MSALAPIATEMVRPRSRSRAALAKGIKASLNQKLDREWRDHIEIEAKKRTLKI